MHLFNQNSLISQKSFNARMRLILKELKHALGVDARTFMDLIQVSAMDYRQILKGTSEASIAGLHHLARSIHVNDSALYTGEIDFEAVGRQFRGDHHAVPKRYQDPMHQLSRTRGVQVLLTYFMVHRGAAFVDRILKTLQIRQEFFTDANRYISSKIVLDLFQQLTVQGIALDEMMHVGMLNIALTPTELKKTLGAIHDPRQSYLYFHEELITKFYDRMFDYRLRKISNAGTVGEVHVREEAQDIFKEKILGSKAMCNYRKGVYSSHLLHSKSKVATVLESECMYEGGHRCVYHLSW